MGSFTSGLTAFIPCCNSVALAADVTSPSADAKASTVFNFGVVATGTDSAHAFAIKKLSTEKLNTASTKLPCKSLQYNWAEVFFDGTSQVADAQRKISMGEAPQYITMRITSDPPDLTKNPQVNLIDFDIWEMV